MRSTCPVHLIIIYFIITIITLDEENKLWRQYMWISSIHLSLPPRWLNININKKFWEELMTYVPWYNKSHTENDKYNNSFIVACVFVTAVTFLPSRCLATIGQFLPSRCLATIGGFLPSRCLAMIGGIHRHTHTHSNVISWAYSILLNKESRLQILNRLPYAGSSPRSLVSFSSSNYVGYI
jgi:hypothetical protein